MVEKKLTILIGGPLTLYRLAHLKKILKLVDAFFDSIQVVYEGKTDVLSSNGKITAFNIGRTSKRPSLPFQLRVFGYLRQDFSKIRFVSKCTGKSNEVLFLGIYQPLSLAAVRLKGGYPLHFCGGFDVVYLPGRGRFFNEVFLHLRWAIQVAMLSLSRKLIFESPSVLDDFNLKRFENKSVCNGHLFVDFSKFAPVTPLGGRDYDVAYVGALSQEKGAIPFVEGLVAVMTRKKIRAQIIGDGNLRDAVTKRVFANGFSGLVDFEKRVDYSGMPAALNRIRLLVVPSYSEGLPNIVLEAMACGTVVLATPVGGIPDVIKDGENGFLLSSNNPQHIAERVLELMNNPDLLEETSKNAYEYVKENFNYKTTLENWREVFGEIEL